MEHYPIASFTTGCQTIPPQEQLDLLPGKVSIFYDRNDQPLPNGDLPGEVGAKKVAQRLGDRGRVALVPMPNDCSVKGWDVSEALNAGFTLEHFEVVFQICCCRNPRLSPSPLPRGTTGGSSRIINMFGTLPSILRRRR